MESFEWDSNIDFFGVEPTLRDNENSSESSTKSGEINEEIDTNGEDNDIDAPSKKSKKSKTVVEEESDEDDITVEDNLDEEDEDDESSEPKGEVSVFTDLYKDLKDKGLFKHTDIDEDEDLDSERFFELQEEEIEKEIENRLNNWANNELDEDAKALIEFVRNGGKTQDFFKVYNSQNSILDGDIEDENFQDRLIRMQLSDKGLEDDEIEDTLETLSDNGKKQKVAERYLKKLQEEAEEERKELLEENKKKQEQIKKNEQAFTSEIKELLNKTEDIKGIKFDKSARQEVFDFLTKRNIKEGNSVMTGFNKGLKAVFEDKEKVLLLARLIQTDFDFSSIERQAKNKKTKEIKTNLEQRGSLRSNDFGSSSKPSSKIGWFK